MMNTLHPGVALDMYKIETQHRMAKLEHRRAAMERQHSRPAPQPKTHSVHSVRRTTLALAGAVLAFSAAAIALL